MDVARGGGLRGVEVAVGVDIEDAEALSGLLRPGAHAGEGAEGDGVVAAEDERESALRRGGLDLAREGRAGVPDGRQVLRARIALLDVFLRLDRHGGLEARGVVAERFEALADAGEADGRGPHVGAVAAGPEVERHFKDVDVHGGADNR